MAWTATATSETRRAVCLTLGMVSLAIISEVPNRPNYSVHVNPGTLEEAFSDRCPAKMYGLTGKYLR